MKPKKTDNEEKQDSVKVKDESRDHIYYTITPRLVWALAQDTYELALWIVIKDIAGENGECFLAREDLADLAMMSSGKVSSCRDRLIEKRLLKGELKRDPGYPQEVWHLSIPDFWEANVRWARMYPTIRSRVAYKREQLGRVKDPSLHDGSEDPSLHDERIPPGDERIPPGDTKNNVLEKPKEEVNIKELRELFTKAADYLFPDAKDLKNLETIRGEISQAGIEIVDRSFIVSGLGDRAEYYESRYKRSFERALIGFLGEEVPVSFVTGGVSV